MNVSLEERWETFVTDAVREGRFVSASDVVHEGLRLVAEREIKRAALTERLQAALIGGRDLSEQEVDASIETAVKALRREGY